MVRIPRSEQSVGLSGQPLPASTGDGFEAPGKALQQVGKQISSFAAQWEEQQNELADFDGKLKYQTFVNEVDRRRREADTNVTGDGRGHTDRLDTDTDTAFERFLGENQHLPARTQQRLQLQYGGDRRRFSTRSFTAEQNRIGPYYSEQGNAWFNSSIVPRLFERDPQTGQPLRDRLTDIGLASAEIDRFVDGAPGMPPATRERLRQDLAKRMFQLWQHEARDEGPEERARIIEMLRAGTLDAEEQPADITQPGQRRTGLELRPVPGNRTPRGARPRQGNVQGIVLHHTAGSSLEGALSQNQLAGTGYNYYVDRKGEVYQFAPDSQRMVHIRNPGDRHRTGAFANLTLENTIGISAVAKNDGDITPVQREAMRKLTVQLAKQHGLAREHIIGHGDIQSNRESDEGRMARDFREGRLALGGPQDGPTRVAGSTLTRNDASPAGSNLPVVQAQTRTEDLVRDLIIQNGPEIDKRARSYRIQQETDENRTFVRNRNALENDLFTRARRTREMIRRGEVDPEYIEQGGGLTMDELRRHSHIIRPTKYESLWRMLEPTRNPTRISEPGLFPDLMQRARQAGNAGTEHPQVIIDLAHEAHSANRLTTQHFNLVIDIASRQVNEQTRTPPFVSDHFSTLRRAMLPRGRRPTEQESAAYDDAASRLNSYVEEQRTLGTLDNGSVGKFTTELVETRRSSQHQDTMGRLRSEPRPRHLTVPVDDATMEHVNQAIQSTRRDYESATTPEDKKKFLEEAYRLRLLHEALTERHRMQNRGQNPPPMGGGGRTGSGEGQPPGPFEQFPLTPSAQPGKGKPKGNGSAAPKAPEEQPAQPPSHPLKGTPNFRTFRRIVRDADGNIEGLVEEPAP